MWDELDKSARVQVADQLDSWCRGLQGNRRALEHQSFRHRKYLRAVRGLAIRVLGFGLVRRDVYLHLFTFCVRNLAYPQVRT